MSIGIKVLLEAAKAQSFRHLYASTITVSEPLYKMLIEELKTDPHPSVWEAKRLTHGEQPHVWAYGTRIRYLKEPK